MADTTISPNMNLPVPTVSEDFGPDWANNLNACLSAVDTHNHTSGQGVQIPPSGLNINVALPMGNNQLTQTQAVVFQAQSSLSTLQAVYVSGVDLYYNDGSGNVVRITQSGSVSGASGTITGLPSGTASASYQSGSGTFQFQSATNTPANITGATVYIAEQTTSPNIIGLKSPTSLAASYDLTMPAALPASTQILQLSSSGVVTSALAVDNSTLQNSGSVLSVKDLGITTAKLASQAVTAAKITDATITTTQVATGTLTGGSSGNIASGTITPYNSAAPNSASTSSSSTFTTSSTSFTQVTNLSATITPQNGSHNRPMLISVQPDGSGDATLGISGATGSATYALLRGSTTIATFKFIAPVSQLGSLQFIDFSPESGTNTYKLQAKVSTGSIAAEVFNMVLVVMEL